MKNSKTKKPKKYTEAQKAFIDDAARQYAGLIVQVIEEQHAAKKAEKEGE